ncbi:MAG: 50S ribosomal protein L9 [candidate division Zixibacteria bacterium]|nr:50S ribosomal protein L9 [candidate division Zixibacteria bacterium]
MKVILKDDIKELGACGEVVDVKGGYARNYLIPRNLAIPATKGNVKSIEEIKVQKNFRDNKRKRDSERIKDKLEKLSLTAEVQVGEEDKVFGSVTASNIANLIHQQGFEIDRRLIQLDEPIKALGVYTISIKLDKDVLANVKLWVVKKEESVE